MLIEQLATVIRLAIEGLDAERVECDQEEIVNGNLIIKNEIYKCEGLRKLHLEVAKTDKLDAVSYTHLTLPTICSV